MYRPASQSKLDDMCQPRWFCVSVLAVLVDLPAPIGPIARSELTGREEVESMPTTVWRFSGTEGADEAVLKLKQLEPAKLVEVQDVVVLRWPAHSDVLRHADRTPPGPPVCS
jgi:hypothetical protein